VPPTGQRAARRTPPPQATRANPTPGTRDRDRYGERERLSDRERYSSRERDRDRYRERDAGRARPGYGRSNRTASRAAAMRTARTVVALVSALVLGLTWYGWATVDKLTSGITRFNLIDPTAKNDTGPQNILLVGIDTRTDAQGNPLSADILNQLHAGDATDGGDATDTMIVIHIPAGGAGAVAFSIPRDSYVDLTGGFGKHKINSAYTYAEVAAAKQLRAQGVTGAQLALQSAQAGAKNAVDTVEQFTGLQINHFASVNLVGFYDISQAIGGVQVCLNKATKDPYSGANFPAGVQTISGAQALAFVRQRHNLPNGDLDRIKRQQVFMAAMAHEVLSAGVLTNSSKLNSLISAIQKSITLDQDWDVLSFAQQLQGMSAGQIQFFTIPIVNITYHTVSDGDAVEVDPSAVQSFAQNLVHNADNPPPPPPAASAAAKPATPTTTANTAVNAAITAQVYNNTGISGLASGVLAVLTGQGYTSGGTGNGPARTTTVIDYATGDQAAAQQVGQALGGHITMVTSKVVSTGTVRVYLGKDYTGPKGAGSTAKTSTPTGTAPTPPAITAGSQNCIN
jgi:LCP family protein required for cell wall assembly